MNGVQWLKWLFPGKRAAKYFVRILNRLKNEYSFQIAPVYDSSRNNKLQDDLSRLSTPEAVKLGISKVYTSADVGEIAKSYLAGMLQSFAVLLPTDHGDHVAAVMQYVEKRIERSAPSSAYASFTFIALGYGANSWRHTIARECVVAADWVAWPWPSEMSALNGTGFAPSSEPPIPIKEGRRLTLMGATPRNIADMEYIRKLLSHLNPWLVVLDQRPKSLDVEKSMPWLDTKRTSLSWCANAASWGDSQARGRRIIVSPSFVGHWECHTSPFSCF